VVQKAQKLMGKRRRLMGGVVKREGLIHGSLVRTRKKCGRKQCSCEKGDLHPHIYLSTRVKGKNRIVYLSQKQARTIGSRLKAYREVTDLLESVSDLNIQLVKLEAKSKRKHVANR